MDILTEFSKTQVEVWGFLPDLRSRRGRDYVYSGDGELGVLVVGGDHGGGYLVQWLPEEAAVAFAHQTDEDAAIYTVKGGVCSCPAGRRSLPCKHAQFAAVLVGGKLGIGTAPRAGCLSGKAASEVDGGRRLRENADLV